MKRLLLLIAISISVAVGAMSQTGLSVNELFDGRYRNNPSATETVMNGGSLTKYDLTLYHSLTFTGDSSQATAIERLVAHDGAAAREKEVTYRHGQLYYGFYVLPRVNGKHRYLFYLNQYAAGVGDKIILIYIEGNAGKEAIKKLLK